jgi:outer membrane biosynthesis protein TonB
MNPPSMESIFLILSGVVLAAGVLYWFWSHIQLTPKKVQLLENAVFELRGMLTQGPAPAQEQEQSQPQLQEQEQQEQSQQ